jgi:hypothetical protein
MNDARLQRVSIMARLKRECGWVIPMPSGVTAPRPVTTTLRIAFYDELDDVWMRYRVMDSKRCKGGTDQSHC